METVPAPVWIASDPQCHHMTANRAAYELMWNIQTNVNVWSKELEALYGLEPGEFGGTYEDWARWVHPEDLPKAEADVQNALTTGEFFTDWRVVWQDGSIHWLHARARVFYDDDGNPLKMVGINLDITEQQAALRKRKQAEAERDRSELVFRTLANTMPQMVWVTRADGYHEYFNQR